MTGRERYGWLLIAVALALLVATAVLSAADQRSSFLGFALVFFGRGLFLLITEDAARNVELPTPPIGGPSAADKALWGFIRMMAPLPIQEIVRQATEAEHLASICGWIHVSGRWYWHRESNTLAKVSAQFVAAFERAAHAGLWDE